MQFKTFILPLMLLLSPTLFAGSLEDYISKIKNECSSVNELVIKKSLIEITQSQNCASSFTSKILNECTKMSCTLLLSHWSAFNSNKNGAVIGK
jgi:hypothetical protein